MTPWYSQEWVDAAIAVVYIAIPLGWMLWQEVKDGERCSMEKRQNIVMQSCIVMVCTIIIAKRFSAREIGDWASKLTDSDDTYELLKKKYREVLKGLQKR